MSSEGCRPYCFCICDALYHTYKVASSKVKHINFDARRWGLMRNRTPDTTAAHFINKSSRRFLVGHIDGLHMMSPNRKNGTVHFKGVLDDVLYNIMTFDRVFSSDSRTQKFFFIYNECYCAYHPTYMLSDISQIPLMFCNRKLIGE